MTLQKSRLTPDDWLRAGFRALVANGPAALKAESLARALSTTKGSFYWHFKDVPEFRARMLRHWQEAALVALSRAAEEDISPTDRLYQLSEIAAPEDDAHGGAAAEPAVRAWAQSDPEVSRAVAEIDAARIAYLAAVLSTLGLTNPEFARILYGAHLGMVALPGGDTSNRAALSTLMAAIRALEDA